MRAWRTPVGLDPPSPSEQCSTGGSAGTIRSAMSTTRGLALLADRGFWLLDLKTGKQYPTELALQLAGYAGADGLVVWDEEAMPTTSSPACASTAGGPVPL